MRLSVIPFLLCSTVAFAQNTALDQMRTMEADNLANTQYYNQVHDSKKSQDTSMRSTHGAFTTMRENAGAGFDTSSTKIRYDEGVTNRNVDGFVKESEQGKTIIIPKGVSVPPVSAPVSISAEETDDMFLNALGETSSANSYKGDYETAVGKQQAKDFDMSEHLSQAAEKQNRANAQFAADVAVAKQKRAEEEARRAAQAQQNSTDDDDDSFWGRLGKTFMQGMVNVGIEATNHKYGTNIETIGNKKKSSGSGGGSCTYYGKTFGSAVCDNCIRNKPRSSYDCDKCCRSFRRSLMQAPSYSATSSGGRPAGCLCRFGPTSGIAF